jgi:hypothetical protein
VHDDFSEIRQRSIPVLPNEPSDSPKDIIPNTDAFKTFKDFKFKDMVQSAKNVNFQRKKPQNEYV